MATVAAPLGPPEWNFYMIKRTAFRAVLFLIDFHFLRC